MQIPVNRSIKILLDKLGEPGKVLLMGILNVTADSFYDGGRYNAPGRAVERIGEMIRDGADIIDIGGESTRPGSEPVEVKEELKRVMPVIEEALGRYRELRDGSVGISVDTYKSEVARKAAEAGAVIINDISSSRFDARMPEVIKEYGLLAVLMHMQGVPRNMQAGPKYDNVVVEIKAFLSERIDFLESRGIPRRNILIDPGIGFGKTTGHNIEILRRLEEFNSLQAPVLIGISRKSFIGRILGTEKEPLPPEERLEGSIVACINAVSRGARILRVHDVRQFKYALKVFEKLKWN